MQWINDNAVTIAALVGALYALARAIVALTPTPKDDEALARVTPVLRLLASIFGLDLRQGLTTRPPESTTPPPPKAGPLAVLLAATLMLSGCCTHAPLLKPVAVYQAVNEGHAADESLPAEARAIGQDNADAWAVMRWRLGGPKPSAEVLARVGGSK